MGYGYSIQIAGADSEPELGQVRCPLRCDICSDPTPAQEPLERPGHFTDMHVVHIVSSVHVD